MSFYGDNFVWFVGIVEDRNDPLHKGRVRVRCFGIHTDDKNLIPTTALPWSQVMMPATSSSTLGQGTSPTGLEVGSHVVGFFTDGKSMQQPLVMGSYYGTDDLQNSVSETTYTDAPEYLKKKQIIEEANTSSKFEIPLPKDTATYPLNQVTNTEGGHQFEHDDTKIVEYHNSGSHYEIHSNGDKVEINNRDKFTVVIQNDTIYIKGDANMLVEGDVNHTVKGNYNLAVTKKFTVTSAETSQTHDAGEITVAGITQTAHTHTQNTGDHFGAGATTSKPKG